MWRAFAIAVAATVVVVAIITHNICNFNLKTTKSITNGTIPWDEDDAHRNKISN